MHMEVCAVACESEVSDGEGVVYFGQMAVLPAVRV